MKELFGGDVSPAASGELVDWTDGDGDGRAEEPTRLGGKDVEDLERRRLLEALALLGVSVSPLTTALDVVQNAVDRVVGREGSKQAEDWEETVAEYGYTYLTASPARLIVDLTADLVTVQSILSSTTSGNRLYSSWLRIAGGLTALIAKTLCNLGQSRDARRWWWTAQHAADASGDIELALWVTGERLTHGLYEPRPAHVLLGHAMEAIERASDHHCAGLANVHTSRAQLFASIGRSDAALQEINRAQDVYADLPANITDQVESVHGWAEDRLRYTEAWVHAHLGQTDPLETATSRSLSLLPAEDQRSAVQIRLLRAFGHVRAGDVAEGVQAAGHAFGQHPASQRTTMITSLGARVLDAIPADQRTIPSVAAYRDLVTQPLPCRAIT